MALPRSARLYLDRIMAVYSNYSEIQIRDQYLELANLQKLQRLCYLPECIIDSYFILLETEYPQSEFKLINPSICSHVCKAARPVTLDQCALAPICMNSHWILAVVDPFNEVIHVYDSLGPSNNYKDGYLINIYHWFKQKYNIDLEIFDIKIVDNTSFRQLDGTSCGLFVMQRAKALITGLPMLSFDKAIDQRYKVLWELLFGLLMQV